MKIKEQWILLLPIRRILVLTECGKYYGDGHHGWEFVKHSKAKYLLDLNQ